MNYDIKLIFCKLKEAKKRGFDCLQAQNAQKAWISFFASLKKSKKTWIHFFFFCTLKKAPKT